MHMSSVWFLRKFKKKKRNNFDRLFGLMTFGYLMWLQGMKVNLIITDYSMPGMTGYELLKKIKVSPLRLALFYYY